MKRLTLALATALLIPGLALAEEAAPAPTPTPAPAPAPAAKLTAAQVLEKMDATNNNYTDQTMEMALTVKEAGGTPKTYEFAMFQKGDTKRLLTFSSGEMKGMATLVEDRNNVHVYLPGFKKVRRVTANTMSAGFAGSDMSNDDQAITAWAKGWVPAMDKEDDGFYYIALTPKPEEKTEYTKVVHKVDKTTLCQMETKYYGKGGELLKTLVGSKNTDFGNGIHHNMHVEITDARTGHMTIMETKAFKFNTGLKDDLFTVRQLQWGK
jgi:outer membrane lipoprotein-sorting protein